MINILIADDDLDYATILLNYLNNYNPNVRVCGITCDGKATVNKINSSDNIDIVLLDLKIPIYNGQEVLERVSDKLKYKNSFIVVSGEIDLIHQLRKNDMVFGVFNKSIGIDNIALKISDIIECKQEIIKRSELKSKIINELLYLGYDVSHKGTQYLIRVIYYIVTHPDEELEQLEKSVYPRIAKKYGKSVNNIKCNIARATDSMYYECEIDKMKEYFCFSNDIKPTSKTVINTITNKIS